MTVLPRALGFASALALCAAPAVAGILTVGPSGQFAEISAAVAAAQPGDVILVEPGTYQRFEVQIPLKILGDGTGDVVVTSAGQNAVVVSNVAAGGEVVLSGLVVRGNPVLAPVQAAVRVVDCAAAVTLHDLVIDDLFPYPSLHVERCERVMLLASAIPKGGGPSAVVAIDSELWIAGSSVIGKKPVSGFVEPGCDAVRVVNGTLRVWSSTLEGADGSNGKPMVGLTGHGGDGIDATASTVVLYGGPGAASGAVRGGDGGGASLFGSPGVGGAGLRLAQGSSATIQQLLPITGGFDAAGTTQTPALVLDGSSQSAFDAAVYPTLAGSAAQVALGGAFSLELRGSPSSVAVLFGGPSSGPTTTFPGVLGAGALNPAQFAQLAVLQLDGSGLATAPLAVPPVASLLGATVFFQAAEAAGAQIALTNPAVAAVTN